MAEHQQGSYMMIADLFFLHIPCRPHGQEMPARDAAALKARVVGS